jgi:hypothetical protein
VRRRGALHKCEGDPVASARSKSAVPASSNAVARGGGRGGVSGGAVAALHGALAQVPQAKMAPALMLKAIHASQSREAARAHSRAGAGKARRDEARQAAGMDDGDGRRDAGLLFRLSMAKIWRIV